jgi:hypothetical protein
MREQTYKPSVETEAWKGLLAPKLLDHVAKRRIDDPWLYLLEAMYLKTYYSAREASAKPQVPELEDINPSDFEDFLKAVNRGAARRGIREHHPESIDEFMKLPKDVRSQYVEAYRMYKGQG